MQNKVKCIKFALAMMLFIMPLKVASYSYQAILRVNQIK